MTEHRMIGWLLNTAEVFEVAQWALVVLVTWGLWYHLGRRHDGRG